MYITRTQCFRSHPNCLLPDLKLEAASSTSSLCSPSQWEELRQKPASAKIKRYRSDAQKTMVEAICENEMPGAVFVLPTAGGKSLAYIVPCLCDPVPSMTIATIPFIAVKDEAFVNAHRAGIHAVDYKPGFQATVPLLMLSAEYITTPEFETFETFIRGKASEGVLRRIIIDEMHVVLIDGKWPNCMDTVHWIIELNVRVTPDVRTTEQCLF